MGTCLHNATKADHLDHTIDVGTRPSLANTLQGTDDVTQSEAQRNHNAHVPLSCWGTSIEPTA